MKPEALTGLYRYTIITNNLRLSRVFMQEGRICRLPFHVSGCYRPAYAAARPSTESYGRTKATDGTALCMLNYGEECRYLLIFQAIVEMYI